jgi:hypothetical protein
MTVMMMVVLLLLLVLLVLLLTMVMLLMMVMVMVMMMMMMTTTTMMMMMTTMMMMMMMMYLMQGRCQYGWNCSLIFTSDNPHTLADIYFVNVDIVSRLSPFEFGNTHRVIHLATIFASWLVRKLVKKAVVHTLDNPHTLADIYFVNADIVSPPHHHHHHHHCHHHHHHQHDAYVRLRCLQGPASLSRRNGSVTDGFTGGLIAPSITGVSPGKVFYRARVEQTGLFFGNWKVITRSLALS